MKASKKIKVFLIKFDDGSYLRYCSSGWGPSRMTTKNILEAEHYSSVEDAGRVIKSGGWARRGCKVIRATFTETIEIC